METTKYQELFLTAFNELRDEGETWHYLADVAQRAASHDDAYMKRRQRTNRVLGFLGIHRSDLPDGLFYPPRGGVYPLMRHMETEGIITSVFESVPSAGEHRRRLYGLVESLTTEEMEERFPEDGSAFKILALHPEITLRLTDEQAEAARKIDGSLG